RMAWISAPTSKPSFSALSCSVLFTPLPSRVPKQKRAPPTTGEAPLPWRSPPSGSHLTGTGSAKVVPKGGDGCSGRKYGTCGHVARCGRGTFDEWMSGFWGHCSIGGRPPAVRGGGVLRALRGDAFRVHRGDLGSGSRSAGSPKRALLEVLAGRGRKQGVRLTRARGRQ